MNKNRKVVKLHLTEENPVEISFNNNENKAIMLLNGDIIVRQEKEFDQNVTIHTKNGPIRLSAIMSEISTKREDLKIGDIVPSGAHEGWMIFDIEASSCSAYGGIKLLQPVGQAPKGLVASYEAQKCVEDLQMRGYLGAQLPSHEHVRQLKRNIVENFNDQAQLLVDANDRNAVYWDDFEDKSDNPISAHMSHITNSELSYWEFRDRKAAHVRVVQVVQNLIL